MDQGTAINLVSGTMRVMLLVSAPVLGAGLVVGLLTSVLQVVTSIQDANLTALPRVAAMVLAAYFAFPWILRQLTFFTVELFNQFPAVAR